MVSNGNPSSFLRLSNTPSSLVSKAPYIFSKRLESFVSLTCLRYIKAIVRNLASCSCLYISGLAATNSAFVNPLGIVNMLAKLVSN